LAEKGFISTGSAQLGISYFSVNVLKC